MELYFLLALIVFMATALGSGFPVAFALPGAAILAIGLAGLSGLIFAGDAGAYFHSGDPWQWLSAGVTNLRSVYWVPERDTLIAVPLFIFMGIMLQKSKIAEDLLVTMAQLFGPVPGGLGISVVFVGALLAATTGIVGATVVAMGLISLPAMLRNNYSTSLATGTIAASGTLGQIIPPSIVLIILADQLATATDQAGVLRSALYKAATGEFSMPSSFDVASTSAGEMFLGALVPGLVLVGLYMVYILIFAMFRPSAAPAVGYDGKFDARFWRKVGLTLVPPLTLIFLVLGSIITGVATVNQAGAIGAAGAMVMAGYRLTDNDRGRYFPAILGILSVIALGYAVKNYNMNIKLIQTPRDLIGIWIGIVASAGLIVSLVWSALRVYRIDNTMYGVMIDTAKTTSLVFVILMGAAILTAAFRAFGGEDLVRNFLNSLPGGFWTQFIIVMGVIFILGFFLDFIEIAVVVVPIVAPILLADPGANITAVWLGVMIGLNIQTSFLTPPFGFALFYLRGVAPASVKTIQIYKGVIPFILLQLVALGIVGYNPKLVNYLPNRVSYLSETSPPPRNPKLQYCLQYYVADQLAETGDAVSAAIARARTIDLSMLPEQQAKALSASFASADAALSNLDSVFTTEATVQTAAVDYRPRQVHVRDLQKQMRRIDARIDKMTRNASYLNDAGSAAKRQRLNDQIAVLQGQRDAVAGTIPATWKKTYGDFQALIAAENKAGQVYRRSADGAVEPVVKFLDIIASNADFAALEGQLRGLKEMIRTGDPKEAEARLKQVGSLFNKVAGARDVASPLSKARRALRKKPDDRGKALEQFDKAVAAYEAQLTWRAAAEQKVKPGLETYLAAMADTVGVRQQPRLSRDQALYLSSCNAVHRDVSLNF